MSNFVPTVDEVYRDAVAEHPDFQRLDKGEVRDVISAALGRIATFEEAGHKPAVLSPESAESIGTIWVFSGTGSYDEDFKPEDNPRYMGRPGFGGMDRARMIHAAHLARRIAGTKSGLTGNNPTQVRELIAAHGPALYYSGYPVESANAEKLLDRPDMIIPRSKVKILHADLKVTADQVATFEYPDEPGIENKDVIMVSHAAHLGGRILNIAEHCKPFEDGVIPYVSPIPAPDQARREAAMTEARGLVWYVFGNRQAAKTAHPYRLLPGQGE